MLACTHLWPRLPSGDVVFFTIPAMVLEKADESVWETLTEALVCHMTTPLA
ncbi:MAG: hypothetical protein H6577_26305 [Lewinellaceae bacterium]|nr:hypothetical protein [Lewinellaceae bacterium]